MKHVFYAMLLLTAFSLSAAEPAAQNAEKILKQAVNEARSAIAPLNAKKDFEGIRKKLEECAEKQQDPNAKARILAMSLEFTPFTADQAKRLTDILALPGLTPETKVFVYSNAFYGASRGKNRAEAGRMVLASFEKEKDFSEKQTFSLLLGYYNCHANYFSGEEGFAGLSALKVPSDASVGEWKTRTTLLCRFALKSSRWMEPVPKDGYAKALKATDDFLAKYPNDIQIESMKAEYLAKLGRSDEAFALAEKIIQTPKADVKIQNRMILLQGIILLEKEDYAAAMEKFKNVRSTSQREAPLYMAKCCMAQGDYAGAIENLERHIKLYGKTAERAYRGSVNHLKTLLPPAPPADKK